MPHTRAAVFFVAAALSGAPLHAQTPPVEIGGVTLSGSLRVRAESSDWFGSDPNGAYTYSGSIFRITFGQSRPRIDWQFEGAVPVLLGLPDDAVAPAPAGPLGGGANYFAANDNRTNAAAFFAKQAFVRIKRIGGVDGHALKLGRMEFVDGIEVTPKPATLAALKRDRISNRLLGHFGFTHVGRSFDGALYVFDAPTLNVTVLAARPTQGVFQVDGWGELDVNVLYGAITKPATDAQSATEWRLFGLWYDDYRKAPVKVDNRALTVRRGDTDPITVTTFGGHVLHVAQTRHGPVDVLAWGAGQTGAWGQLSHRAAAYAAEAGWQPATLPRLAPWIRGGFNYGSGDGNPNDATHGTFFQNLPTARPYARFPFFDMMDTADAFGEIIVRPSKTTSLRADVHSLNLADANDLWYQGGGAFQPLTFGYTGRPSGGHSSLATLVDASADVTVRPRVSLTLYAAHASGHGVTQSIYPGSSTAWFGYAEVLLRF